MPLSPFLNSFFFLLLAYPSFEHYSYTFRHNLERQVGVHYLQIVTKREWLCIQDMMEVNGRASHSNQKKPSENSTTTNLQKKPSENNSSTPVFVNHAATAWNESRRKWIGNVAQTLERTPKDPIISWSMTYEDLLSTQEPFSEPIPLSEMVDFLVDIWHDEGLFD